MERKSIENLLGMLPDRIVDGKDTYIFTPPRVAKDMINSLPDSVWNRHSKFLDPICKSGIFLYYVYMKLMESPDLIEAFPDKQARRKYILKNQIFGIAVNRMCQAITVRTVYGSLNEDNNIILLDNYDKIMRNKDRRFIIEVLKKELGVMKFDLVVGNPPYNKGMDLDFVDLAFEISNRYVLMITPAKWQTAESNQKVASNNISYGEFRKRYVPYMSHVCFYPDCKDVFDIMQADGISWYLIDMKHTCNECTIENKLDANDIINSTCKRSLVDSKTLFNAGDEIIRYMGEYDNFYFNSYTNGRFRVLTNNHAPGGALYAFSKTASKVYIIGKSYLIDSNTNMIAYGETSIPNDAVVVFTSDNLNECESFMSWLNTKFVRFFVAINISKLAPMMCNECFKLVPAPPSGKFDHIYTDEELYRAFNLPQEYIKIIESLIKERK